MDKNLEIPWIGPDEPFPPLHNAMEQPNGLLAAGGDLSSRRILDAYKKGIFPWYSKNQPILWWSPNPRLILYPDRIRISKSLRKSMKRSYQITMDQSFSEVIVRCQAPRKEESETWITNELLESFNNLHELGYAHSVEVWLDSKLIGGLYGLAIGKAFFGESMFSSASNASKIALVALANKLSLWNYGVIDCQISSKHLMSMGAEEISRQKFALLLATLVNYPVENRTWKSNLEIETRKK